MSLRKFKKIFIIIGLCFVLLLQFSTFEVFAIDPPTQHDDGAGGGGNGGSDDDSGGSGGGGSARDPKEYCLN